MSTMLLGEITNQKQQRPFLTPDFRVEYLGLPSDFILDGVIPFKYYLSEDHGIGTLDLDRVPAAVLRRAAKHRECAKIIKIDSLNLTNNEIKQFPKVFRDHPTITELDLSDNLLKKLSNLPPNVKNLTLNGNHVNDIRDIHHLQRLETISMETCNLTLVPNPEVFTQLLYLTKISLAGNVLTTIPDELAYCRKLTDLNLSENQFTAIPEDNALYQLRVLEDLNLSGNELKRFVCPNTVKNIILHSNRLEQFILTDQLQQVQIADNCLKSLNCKNKPNLKWLDFSLNELEEMPKYLYHTSITQLYARGNRITELPRTISRMRDTLEVLDVSANDIQNVHENVAALHKLAQLNVENNGRLQLGIVHYRYLTNLSNLSLENTTMTEQTLTDLLSFGSQSLESLNLRNTSLERLPSLPVWRNVCNLTHLTLSENKLQQVPTVLFESLPKMESLLLDSNSLSDMRCLKGMHKLGKLKILDLSNNQIERLEQILLELRHSQGLEHLDLRDNPVKGAFESRDITLLSELQYQIFAVRKIFKFFKNKKMLRKFRRTVMLAREASANEKKGKKKGGRGKSAKKGKK